MLIYRAHTHTNTLMPPFLSANRPVRRPVYCDKVHFLLIVCNYINIKVSPYICTLHCVQLNWCTIYTVHLYICTLHAVHLYMSTVHVLTHHLVVGRVLKDLCVILKRDEQRPESIPRPRKGHFWTALIYLSMANAGKLFNSAIILILLGLSKTSFAALFSERHCIWFLYFCLKGRPCWSIVVWYLYLLLLLLDCEIVKIFFHYFRNFFE